MSEKKQRINDMTQGRPLALIVKFSLPLMVGQFLQQFYVVADTAIVGQGVGVEALAAVGATDWLYWLFLWTTVGFGQGFAIPIAIRFGEKNYTELRKSVKNSILLGAVIGVGMSVIGAIIAGPMLTAINTPSNLIAYSHTYLVILYIGICVVMMYNIAGCILRALGDSKSPLIALLISSVLNVVLDLIFVLVLGWGIAGAGVATVISQIVSTIYSFMRIKRIELLKSEDEKWQINGKDLVRMLRYGVPIGLQMMFIAVGGIVFQYMLNGFGFLYVAGFTAANKLVGILEAIAMSLGYAIATYMGQNYGARKLKRIRAGMKAALELSVVVSLVIGATMIIFGRNILMLFISPEAGTANQVLAIGYKYLVVMSFFLFALHMIHVYRHSLAGFGNTLMPMLSGVVEGGLRGFSAVVLTLVVGINGIFFVEITAWVGGAALVCVAYYVSMHKFKHKYEWEDERG